MSTNPPPCVAVSPSVAESSAESRAVRRWRELGVEAVGRFLNKRILTTVVTSFVLFGMMTLQGVFLSRMLEPESRGQYSTAIFYTQTLLYIGLLGTHHAVVRWAARRNHDLGGLWRVTSRLGVLTGIATFAVVAVLAVIALPPEKRYIAPLCVLAAIYLPLEHVRYLWLSIDHGSNNFHRYNVNRLVAGATFPIMLGIAWACGNHSATLACAIFAAAPLVGLAYQRLTKPTFEDRHSTRGEPTVKRILKRGRPYATAVLVSDLCDRIDYFLFLWLTNLTVLGYYATAVPAANLLLVLPIALALFAFNAGVRAVRKTTPIGVLKNASVVLVLQIISAALFAMVLEPLIVLVFGEEYRPAVPLARWLIPVYAVAGCGRIAEAYLQGRNKAILGVVSRLVGAATMCLVVYFTFDRWAEFSIPRGALAGYVVSSLMLLVAILLDVRGSSHTQGEIAEGQVA